MTIIQKVALVAAAAGLALAGGAAEARGHGGGYHSFSRSYAHSYSHSYVRSYRPSHRRTSSGSGPLYYTNISGHRVHRPTFSSYAPAGASAHCSDGSWSFSEHARGTCSHHGGVASWR